MSAIPPVVRHMLLCQAVRRDPGNPARIDLLGLIANINAGPSATYPLRLPDLRVIMQLTGGRGEGKVTIEVREAGTEALVWRGPEQSLVAPPNPLSVRMLTVQLDDCRVPRAGLYWVEFCYNHKTLAQEPLLVR